MAVLLTLAKGRDRERVIFVMVDELRAWRPVLAPDAIVVLDDYAHPGFPGVKQAVQELGLAGEQRETMFVHRIM